MSTYVYRDATAEDAAEIAAFAERAFTETFGHLYPPEDLHAFVSSRFRAHFVAAEIADPETRYYVALRDGVLVGYFKTGAIDMDVDPTDAVELHRLYVGSDAKGAGVAQTLMDEALAWARRKNAKAMYLSVWENNERAQRFYRRYGFEHVGEHKFMVGRVADRDFIWRLAL